MARARSDRPTPPRLPPDSALESGFRLDVGSAVSHATIQADCAGLDLEGLIVEDSHIIRSSFTAADLNRLHLVDVLVEESDFSGADMGEAFLSRVAFRGCRLSGAQLPRARMQDVRFSETRLDGANFRMVEGERLLFEQVNLARTDFYAAELKATCLFDCDLRHADVSQTKLPGARLHGSVLSEIKGSEYLRDVVIDATQMLPLAQGVFAGLNIRVDEERDTPPS
jgi:uncharacterized protein YjbI with pentapeptide repeats